MSGLHRSYIGAIERAEHNIGLDNVEKIARTFGVSLLDLLSDKALGELHNSEQQAYQATAIVHKKILIELLNRSKDQDYELALIYLAHSGLIVENR